jgi:hypothetical protein
MCGAILQWGDLTMYEKLHRYTGSVCGEYGRPQQAHDAEICSIDLRGSSCIFSVQKIWWETTDQVYVC